MPRHARIDAPGALQHIIARGVARRRIFNDDSDRDNFLERLGQIVTETATICFAWALIPNHFHLLLRTGETPIATVMQRLLTGHAAFYNRRHRRYGHLFQNRYRSILCQEDTYLLELVRYIHLNPLRARVVQDLNKLDKYPYCGHSVILGKIDCPWQDTQYIQKLFAKTITIARRRYREFVSKGVSQGRRPDLTGGGLIRSVGGWTVVKAMRKAGERLKGDERILGDSNFVQDVLSRPNERMERKYQLSASGYDLDWLVERVAETLGIAPERVTASGKYENIVTARSLLCFWAVRELGIRQVDLSQRLNLSQPAVSLAVRRGGEFATKKGLTLKSK